MDPIILCGSAIIIVVLLLISLRAYNFFGGRKNQREPGNVPERPQAPRRAPIIVGGRRNVAARRRHQLDAGAESSDDENGQNVRRRPATGAAAAPLRPNYRDDDEEDWNEEVAFDDEGGKIGKKKMAKLQAKAEKRAQREAELQEREERRQREKEREEKKRKQEEKEQEEEKAKEEAERKAKEEQERKEHEEYLKLKEAFAVEEEGYDVDETLESSNLLQEFIQYIKSAKVVSTEELASRFKLRAQDVVDRIRALESEGSITGVIDDRGKFIYISPEELKAVAKFINQRGRVSVQELAEYSNKLIRLEPEECEVFGPDSTTSMAMIWLRGEFLLNAQLPVQPPSRIIDFNISKLIAYAKSKPIGGYPNISYENWSYVAQNKLQICEDLIKLYFDVALDNCKLVPTITGTFTNDRNKSSKEIPLICLAIFLFVQQANRANLRISIDGIERRPRNHSESDATFTRSRRSSFGTFLNQDQIEAKMLDLILGNLQTLLDFIVLGENQNTDYRNLKIRRRPIRLHSLIALDLLFEGCRTSEPMVVMPFSNLVTRACEISGQCVDVQVLEKFIRQSFQSDPFCVAAPFCDIIVPSGPEAVPSGALAYILKRSNSEATMMGLSTGEVSKSKNADSKILANSRKTGKVRHNASKAPITHRMIMASFINGKTIAKSNDIMANTFLHVGRCFGSYIYLLSPFKTALIRRCNNTTIIVGPTANTIRLQNCQDCTMVLMCRRLFIIDCQRCTIYLKTPTKPVLFGAGNNELTLAPYCTWYGDLEKHMASVGISNLPDSWNEPLVFANGDSVSNKVDTSPKPWQLMVPKDFFPIDIPFKTAGDTKTIPGGLPAAYKNAMNDRSKIAKNWTKFVGGLQNNERKDVQEMVDREFQAWLKKTGHSEELEQLRALDHKQRKRNH